MKKSELEEKLAKLQTERDHLETEIMSLDQLLRAVGFSEGTETLKLAAEEVIKGAPFEESSEEAA